MPSLNESIPGSARTGCKARTRGASLALSDRSSLHAEQFPDQADRRIMIYRSEEP